MRTYHSSQNHIFSNHDNHAPIISPVREPDFSAMLTEENSAQGQAEAYVYCGQDRLLKKRADQGTGLFGNLLQEAQERHCAY